MKQRIAVPTLNIAGADDPGIKPVTYEASRSHYRGPFTVCVVPGGHFCHRESPRALLPHLLTHLAGEKP
jgi:surfactin synthase thioesterase subunit